MRPLEIGLDVGSSSVDDRMQPPDIALPDSIDIYTHVYTHVYTYMLVDTHSLDSIDVESPLLNQSLQRSVATSG